MTIPRALPMIAVHRCRLAAAAACRGWPQRRGMPGEQADSLVPIG